jgi:ABC-type glycerol-3-phosphate transport system permease component
MNQKILAYLAAFFICIVHLIPFTCWSTLPSKLCRTPVQMVSTNIYLENFAQVWTQARRAGSDNNFIITFSVLRW